MKKLYVLSIAIIACTAACNNNPAPQPNKSSETIMADNNAKNTTPTTENKTAEPEGLMLMNKSDCGNCHNATTKIVGPSYKDIAAKYPNNAENTAKLTDEVMKGVSGVWSSVPMPPHPALKKEDAEKMVGYILTVGSK